MIRMMILASLIVMLIGCGLLAPPPSSIDAPPAADLDVLFHGDTVVEQKILHSDTIVRAKLSSLSSEIVTDANSKYKSVLKFNFNVSEYLKGTGPSSIVAVWVDGSSYDTRADAEDDKARNLANRDAQWDDREAIIFLDDVANGFGTSLDEQLKRADHFFLAFGDPYSPNDRYSLHSSTNKDWLPAASVNSSSGASSASVNPEFLLDVPSQASGASSVSSASTIPTITLSNLKKRIGEVTAEYDVGTGSEAYKDAYRQCVEHKYQRAREERYFVQVKGRKSYGNKLETSALTSGQPANTALYQGQNVGKYPDQKAKTWFEGTYAGLFSVTQGNASPYDLDGDGKLTAIVDRIKYTETYNTTRPLPTGEYKVTRKEVRSIFLPCNHVLSFDWTVTVTAPVGVIHEAFFDPVNLTGGAIGADKGNGALKPMSFSVNGAATNIERVKWDPSGNVIIDLKPGVSLKGHLIEFIGLNGKPIRSLSFDRSAGTSSAPSWQVCDSPWKAGDLLMIRISAGATAFGEAAKGSACPNAPAPTPTPKPPARGRG